MDIHCKAVNDTSVLKEMKESYLYFVTLKLFFQQYEFVAVQK